MIEVWLKNGAKAEVDADSADYQRKSAPGFERDQPMLVLRKGNVEVGAFLQADVIGWSIPSSPGPITL